jgi:mannosyltransferase
VLVLLAGWALRVHALGAKSLWYDELRQIEVAQAPFGQLENLLLQHAARPLDYLITHFILPGAGPGDGPAGRVEFWLRFPAAVWGLLTLAALWPLARRWLDRRAAWGAWAMFAAAPLAVQYSQELRPYALYLLLSVLSFYHLDCALGLGRRPQRAPLANWAAFALITAAGTLTHFFYVFLLFAQAVFVGGLFVVEWLRSRRWAGRRRRVSGRGLLAFTAGAVAGVGALFVGFDPTHAISYVVDFLGALIGVPVTGGLVSDTGIAVQVRDTLNADFFFRGVLPFWGGGEGPALLAFGALVLLGLVVLARHDRSRLAQALLWLLMAPGLVIIYLQYRQQFFALRYILYALPIYVMLAAAGLSGLSGAVGKRWRRAAGMAVYGGGLALLLVFQLQRVVFNYGISKDDWRRVGEFLTLNTRPGDTLGAPDVQAFIRFYAPRQPAVIVDANDLGPHQEALANGERFWFVVSTYTLDPMGETQAWAESLPGVTFQLDPVIKVIFVDPNATQAQTLAEAQRFVVPPPSVP